ncbi:MAG TPA: murein L,D-transpeptidase [Gammaproteobacteria bacterium]|nr:murein L,D-transpeptidase [Gammaproteobacteria bacterium]
MPDDYLHISLARQCLSVRRDGEAVRVYSVSTARNGPGMQMGSEQTPLGWHRVRARIGAGCAIGTVFRARRPTGEIYTAELAAAHPDRDWILTRILWLCGTERGKNRFGSVDSMRRYIYIHGCPDTEPMGEPRSHGCIRMRNRDLVELFEQVPVGMPVWIEE